MLHTNRSDSQRLLSYSYFKSKIIWTDIIKTQNYLVLDFFIVRYSRKYDVSEIGSVSVLRWGRRVFCFLDYRTMEKVQNPSNSVCYTLSSEPFRIYLDIIKVYLEKKVNVQFSLMDVLKAHLQFECIFCLAMECVILHSTSKLFMRLAASEIDEVVPLLCLLCFHTPCSSCNPKCENQAEWGPMTAVANSEDHHDQSIGSALLVYWNVGVPRNSGSTRVIVFT
jgi:hypothetical protein